ncbi:hypothetical protein [Pseudomonas sp. UC 17F4]|uniref:hypothetical protein n=1 Tax=Pseudomonas sp. UC 17F4 TaxID=1855328 RepID=UPI0015A31542|nr:hypothetical protein [Pseudomonas sp. UC 17F4]
MLVTHMPAWSSNNGSNDKRGVTKILVSSAPCPIDSIPEKLPCHQTRKARIVTVYAKANHSLANLCRKSSRPKGRKAQQNRHFFGFARQKLTNGRQGIPAQLIDNILARQGGAF